VRSHLSFRSKRELLLQIAPRYREAAPALKRVILDEFVAATGYAGKYAIRLLSHPVAPKLAIERPRSPRYGPEVQQALHLAWTAANHICAKRLIPFLPTLVESLERHGHLHLSEECRSQLLSMSPATADRLLRPYRKQERRGIATTRSGTLLKKQIPVRTFQDWNEAKPGLTSSRPGGPLWPPGGWLVPLHFDPDGYCHWMDGVLALAQSRRVSRCGRTQASEASASFPHPGNRHRQRRRVY